MRIIRGKSTLDDKKFLERVIKTLIRAGAEKVVLACIDLANIESFEKPHIQNSLRRIQRTSSLIHSKSKILKSLKRFPSEMWVIQSPL